MSPPLNSTFDIGAVVDGHNRWLGHDLTDLAHEALAAHDERQYTTAANRAGISLEKLLKRILQDGGHPPDPRATLGALVDAIKNAGLAPTPVIERLQEANKIRIRSAHDKDGNAPALRLTLLTVGDSLQILTILALVTDWYGGSQNPPPEPAADTLPIFLSYGGPHRLDQQQFLRRLRLEMQHLGVALHSLRPGEYSPDKPFDQIADLMAECRAALVVGLERSHGYAVFEREQSDGQTVHQNYYTPTAWNQIEGSMASALRLPVVVLRERRLHQEGIFEAKSHRHAIEDFDLGVESKGLSTGLRRFLAGWVKEVRAGTGGGRPAVRRASAGRRKAKE
jgi:hypothetical protein